MKKNIKIKIAVASGKGGVGKSMLTSCLAFLLHKDYKLVAVDCDVDAPNLAVWLNELNGWDETERISTSELAVIDQDKCIKCGRCAEICQFQAVESAGGGYRINPFLCEGCGACEILCPVKAISLKKVKNGELKSKKTKYGFQLFSGQLYPGETGSGKIVAELKEKAGRFEHELMIIDSSPGTGCPVIASLQDVDMAILITEPTPSGFSDLQRVLEVINHFKIPYSVVVNKWDINEALSFKIISWAAEKYIGKISYDQAVFKAIADLTPIMETNLKAKQEIIDIADKIKEKLGY